MYTVGRPARGHGIAAMIIGALMFLTGLGAWALTATQLGEQQITVAEDAPFLAGTRVNNPFAAFAQSEIINTHAMNATGGRTFAEIEQGDPIRETAQTASFLRSALFTSVLAFGLSALLSLLGLLSMIIGHAIMKLSPRRVGAIGGAAYAPQYGTVIEGAGPGTVTYETPGY